jgi:vancomycin resistance protein YoaR
MAVVMLTAALSSCKPVNPSVDITGYEDTQAELTFPEGGRFVLTAERVATLQTKNPKPLSQLGVSDIVVIIETSPVKAELQQEVRIAVEKYNAAEVARQNDEAQDSFDILDDEIVLTKGSLTMMLADELKVLADAQNTLANTLSAALAAKQSKVAAIDIKGTITTQTGDEPQPFDFEALYNYLNREPVNAKYNAETQSVDASQRGVSFDMAAAISLYDDAEDGEKVAIPLVFTEPEVTTEQLEAALFRDVITERTTYTSGTSNRLNNVTLAAAAIDGTVLNPGDTFSFNAIVGERTTARGYKSAGAYASGKVVEEIGGGICQVSSTLYDCVLRADLIVVERRNHMFTISYLPYGIDATINWPNIDFKFQNTTEYPMRIESKMDGRNITIKLIGTKTDTRTIKTDYSVLSTLASKTIYVEDETVPEGTTVVDTEGHPGYVVDTYKLYYDENGTFIERVKVSHDTYIAQNREIHVPIGSLDADGNYIDPSTVTPTPTEPTEPPDPSATPAIDITPEPEHPDYPDYPVDPPPDATDDTETTPDGY